MIDYREALRRYMQTVLECEGTTFLNAHRSRVDVSAEEYAELMLIDSELKEPK